MRPSFRWVLIAVLLAVAASAHAFKMTPCEDTWPGSNAPCEEFCKSVGEHLCDGSIDYETVDGGSIDVDPVDGRCDCDHDPSDGTGDDCPPGNPPGGNTGDCECSIQLRMPGTTSTCLFRIKFIGPSGQDLSLRIDCPEGVIDHTQC